MTIKQPFFPHYGSNQVLAAAATAAAVTIHRADKQVRVVNTGTNKAYFRTYDSDNTPVPVASTADYCVPPGLAATVSKMGHNAISVISASGTTLEVMTGEGF